MPRATGAWIVLLNRGSRKEIEQRVRDVIIVETATDRSFQQYFIETLAIPHATYRF
jgi:uncharacterized 2Fe-2S/4Fe-4S cluster protein (DUF4445 family)